MWSFFRKKVLIIILVSIIVLVTLIGLTIQNRDEVSFPEEILKDTVGWVQNVFRVPTEAVINFFSNVNDLKSTYDQNEVLNEHLAQYKDLLFEVQALKAENEELRDILGIEESLRDYKPIYASVNSRSPEAWIEQITINKGKQHGVEPNMAVRTADGMIGKIKTVYQFTSTVQLLSGFDINNRVSVEVIGGDEETNQEEHENTTENETTEGVENENDENEENVENEKDENNEEAENEEVSGPVYGLIEGYDEEKEALILTVKSKEIKEGQLVVTSGLGGVFPKGIPIGEIISIEVDAYGLSNIGYVKPAADLYNISEVIVVDRVMAEPDENVMEEEE